MTNLIAVGDVVLDDGGASRTVEYLSGWTDMAARFEFPDRAQQDGQWDVTGFRSPREVEAKGAAIFDTHVEAEAFVRSLSALDPRSRYEVSVANSETGVTLTCQGRVPAVTTKWLTGRAVRFEVAFTAPDPLLYGLPVYRATSLAGTGPGVGLTYPIAYPLDYGVPAGVTPGSVSLPNAGTAPYWPRVRIDGPVPNPVVTLIETGAWVRYNGTIPAGQWVDFDLANRRVLLQGQVSVRHRVTSSGNWLAVPVGGAALTWTADSADPGALLSVWGYEMAVS